MNRGWSLVVSDVSKAKPSRPCGPLKCSQLQLVFRFSQRSAKVLSLPLQGETFRLDIFQGALHLLATFGASGIARGRELLGMPHEREAIARVVTPSCLPRPRPVEQRDWPVAVLL